MQSTAWAASRLAAGAALCAVPLSIAVSEFFLAVALAACACDAVRRRSTFHMPRVFGVWLVWAAAEIVAWIHSPEHALGMGELRHLLLIAALFAILPVLKDASYRVRVWKVIFVTATIGSAAVILGFVTRLARYRQELAAGGDPGFYLRNGGLLHHWMIYATVEVIVFAALLEFRAAYPESRRWSNALVALNSAAILLSLTRSLWLACLVVLAAHLIWRRSRWVWLIPLAPVVVFWVAPSPLRARIAESFQPGYYSNAERVQMWHVGWRMIREEPLLGVGPGRVESLYTSYLEPGEPVPAYHGHLHNNALQLAAQFGVPALAAAMLFVGVLVGELTRAARLPADRAEVFLCRTGVMALAGFLLLGVTDYTYGHSLGLILISFAIVHKCVLGKKIATSRTCD